MGDAKQQKITRYFSRRYFVTATQEKCDAFAAKLVGYPVKPTDEQGLCSYTVLAGSKQDKVVQFREETLPIVAEPPSSERSLLLGIERPDFICRGPKLESGKIRRRDCRTRGNDDAVTLRAGVIQ